MKKLRKEYNLFGFFQDYYILSSVLCILYNTREGPSSSVSNKFYIQLALPISPEIMDGF